MDAQLRRIFVREIISQADGVRVGADHVSAALQSSSPHDVWVYIPMILIGAANISKILFPGAEYKIRGEELRGLLGVPDASPLAERGLRNHFEHFDERIQTWAEQSTTRNFIDHVIAPREFDPGQAPADIIRHLDPDTGVFVFRGKEFNLASLVQSAAEVAKAANRVLGSADVVR